MICVLAMSLVMLVCLFLALDVSGVFWVDFEWFCENLCFWGERTKVHGLIKIKRTVFFKKNQFILLKGKNFRI